MFFRIFAKTQGPKNKKINNTNLIKNNNQYFLVNNIDMVLLNIYLMKQFDVVGWWYGLIKYSTSFYNHVFLNKLQTTKVRLLCDITIWTF